MILELSSVPVPGNVPLRRPGFAVDKPQERGLARPVASDEDRVLSGMNVPRYIPENRLPLRIAGEEKSCVIKSAEYLGH